MAIETAKKVYIDCVAMQQDAALELGTELEGLSIEEQLAYWRRKELELEEAGLLKSQEREIPSPAKV